MRGDERREMSEGRSEKGDEVVCNRMDWVPCDETCLLELTKYYRESALPSQNVRGVI